MAFNHVDNTVQISIFAAKFLLPATVDLTVNLDTRWVDLLKTICTVPIQVDGSLAICSCTYNRKGKSGWIVRDLTEPVRHFIQQFTVKKTRYSARLVKIGGKNSNFTMPLQKRSAELTRNLRRFTSLPEQTSPIPHCSSNPQPSTSYADINDLIGIPSSNGVKVPPIPQKRKSGEMICVVPPKKRKSVIMHSNGDLPSGYGFVQNPSNDQGEVGNAPQAEFSEVGVKTEAPGEVNNAQDNGMRDDATSLEPDVVQIANQNLNKFSNSFFLKAEAEYKMLTEKGYWERNADRAPLCSYFISELFRE